MLTLFIDSSRKNLSVALILDNKVVFESNINSYSKHSNFLMNEIVKMFKLTALQIKNLDNIVILNGPGSFTGVRVGTTVAKTLSYVLGNNLYALSTLKALSIQSNANNIISVIFDKDNISYVGIYGEELCEEGYITIDEVTSRFSSSNIDIVCMEENNYVNELYKKLSTNNNVNINIINNYDYLKIIDYALSKEKINPHILEPIYLKKIDAEKNKNDN